MPLFSSSLAASWRERLARVFSKPKSDIDTEALEALLLEADLSYSHVEALMAALKKHKPDSQEQALHVLEETLCAMAQSLDQGEVTLTPPACILLLGVNGSGKTTTTARLAHHLKQKGQRVILAAADTFRAGAVDQLQVWAQRVNVPCVAQGSGADATAVAYDAWERAKNEQAIVLVDTAGRMHNKGPLMEQLSKMTRVLGRDGLGAPHEAWLVIDGNTGQNAIAQAREFHKTLGLTGLIVTKLDGTAKGGAALSGALEMKLPIRYVGVGEQVGDLEVFHLRDYVRRFLGTQNTPQV